MKLRTTLISAVAVAAGLSATAVEARGIPVDATITCSATVSQLLDGSISLGGSNSANIGIPITATLPVYLCNDSVDSDSSVSVLPFSAASSPLYTWIDSTQSPPSVVLGPSPGNEFSFLSGLTAQVGVLSLTGTYAGDTEVQFNYNLDSSNNCPPSSAPTLIWGGQTYTFTGSGSVCDFSVSSDFLFSSSGTPLGYIDSSGNVLLTGLAPPDWSASGGGGTSVTEPGTLALLGLAGLPLLLLVRRRVPASRAI